MATTKRMQMRGLALASSLWLVSLFALWGSPLEAQSSHAAASERLSWLAKDLGGNDQLISEDDVRAYLKTRRSDAELAAAMKESKCGQDGFLDCDSWLDVAATNAFSKADRNEPKGALGPEEIHDFEATVIWGDLTIADLLPEEAPPLPSAADLPAPASALPRWLGTRVTIRRSFLDERGASDPATIAWTHFGGGDETLRAEQRRTRFDIQAAISFELGTERRLLNLDDWKITPVLVIEGDVSTDATIGRDSVTHRFGAQIYGERDIDDVWTAHFIDLTFDYRTDRDYRSEVLGGTFQYSPNMPKVGIGMYQQAGPLFLRWRPYVGLTYADVRDAGQVASLQQSDGFTNAFARLRLETTLWSRFIAAAEGQVVFELEEDDEDHTAYGASLRYLLDNEGHTFVVVSYEQGEKPPSFQSKEQTKIALGIKF